MPSSFSLYIVVYYIKSCYFRSCPLDRKGGQPPLDQQATKAYKRALLWRFLRGSKGLFLLSMVCSMLSALADLLSPQVIRVAVDNVLGGESARLPGFLLR